MLCNRKEKVQKLISPLLETCIFREEVNRKKTFSVGHCPNEGGVLPMPEFLALFQEVHFWSIRRFFLIEIQCNADDSIYS